MKLLIGLVVLWASLAHAKVIFTSCGALTTAQTATGASPDLVCVTTARALVLTFSTTAGTATVDAELSCGGGIWIPVASSSQSIGTSTPNGDAITFPACCYRTNVTACSSCSVTTTFCLGAELH